MKLNAKNELRKTKNKIKIDETIISTKLAELKPAEEDLIKRVDNKTTFVSARDILTQLFEGSENFYNEDNLFGITIDKTSGISKGVLLDDGKHTIKILLNGEDAVGTLSKTDDSKVTFEFFNGKDHLELMVKNNGLQMNLIIPTLRENYAYRFQIVTTNLYSSYSENRKAITFVDQKTKEKVFTIAKPFMTDKNGSVSSAIEMTYTGENDSEHTWEFTLSKDWINNAFRQLPVIMSPRIEINDCPAISLTNYMDSRKFVTNSDELVLGVKNYKPYSIRASIATEQIISELVRTGMKRYSVSLELHYDNGIRIDNSKGIVVFCGSELISENLLKSTENHILIDITEMIKKEIQKYKSGMKISNLSIELLYGNKKNVLGSCASIGSISSRYIKDDYVMVKDKSFAESSWRPEIHLDGVREGEVVPGTPFLEYDTDLAGKSSLNLFNKELSHSLELGSVTAKALTIGVKLLYDTRFLKEQIKNGLKNVFGKGWLLNISQRLVKNDNYSKLLGCKDMTYYDGDNNPHILSEKWYYEKEGARHYIQKDLVFIGNDQKLKYRNTEDEVFDVEYEASNDEGLTLVSTNSKINYIKKSDLKVHKRYFIQLANKKYEVYKDDNGLLEIPQFYTDLIPGSDYILWIQKYLNINDVAFENGKFVDMTTNTMLKVVFLKTAIIL